MDSNQAQWIVSCLHDVDGLPLIDWRVLKKYADDWEEDAKVKKLSTCHNEPLFMKTIDDETYQYCGFCGRVNE